MKPFRLLQAEVHPALNEIRLAGRIERLPPKFIDVLVVLAEHGDQVVSKAELLNRVWGDPLVGDEALSHAVWVLRKALADDAKRPCYIQTVPRRGYRLMQAVSPIEPEFDAERDVATDPANQALIETPGSLAAAEPERAGSIAETASSSVLAATSVRQPRPRWLMVDFLLIALALLGIAWLSWQGGGEPDRASVLSSSWRLGDRLSRFDPLADGRLLIATRNAELLAWSPDRPQPDWRLRLGAPSIVPALQDGDRIFVASDDHYLYALDSASGAELWRFKAGAALRAQPAALPDSLVLADDRGEVVRLALADRRVMWRSPVGGRLRAAVAVEADHVLVGDADGLLSALDLDSGEVRWQMPLGRAINIVQGLSSIEPSLAGEVLVGSEGGRVLRMNAASQAVRWQVETGDANGTPLFEGRQAFLLSRQGKAQMVSLANGQTVWQQQIETAGSQRPVRTEAGIAVLLAGARIGLLDPTDGRMQQQIHVARPIDWLQPTGARLALAGIDGEVRFLPTAPSAGSAWQLSDDGQLRPWQPPAPNAHSLEFGRSAEQAELLWRRKTQGNAQDINFIDGDLLVGDAAGVRRLSLDGKQLWHFSLQQSPGTQFRQAGELILFGGNDGSLYALDSDSGRPRWQFDSADKIRSAPVVVEQMVVFGGVDHAIYCLNLLDGRLLWRFVTEGDVHAEVAVAEGVVYAGSGDQHLYALNLADGKLRWKQAVREWIVAAPLWQDKTLFVPVSDGSLRALQASDGRELWRFDAGGWIWFGLVSDGRRLFFASADGHVYAVDAGTGRERWRQRIGPQAEGRLALTEERLLAGSPEGYLYSLDPITGAVQWRMRAGGAVFNPAASSTHIAVGSSDQTLHLLRAIGPRRDLSESSSSPETVAVSEEP